MVLRTLNITTANLYSLQFASSISPFHRGFTYIVLIVSESLDGRDPLRLFLLRSLQAKLDMQVP